MKYAFVNANIITGLLDEEGNMITVSNAMLLTDGDKITDITASGQPDASYEVIDLNGRYIMPGMINAHVHLVPSNKVSKDKKKMDYDKVGRLIDRFPFILIPIQKMLEKIAREHLYSGVTTIRTVGGMKDIDAKVRNKIKDGRIAGPRMLVCNTAISVPGGHMAGLLATSSASVEDALADLDKIIATDPDWIKLMITGGVLDATEEGEPGVLRMDPAIVKAVCERAHEKGYKVCAHVESPEGVRVALANGVDSIEHGAMPDDEIMAYFKGNKAADICTISPAAPFLFSDAFKSAFGELGEKNGAIVLKGIIECAKRCMAEGVPVGLGTDCGCPCITQYDMWRELVYFNRFCDVTAAQAINTATYQNAQILGIGDVTGSLEVGKCADLIMLESDPLEDLTTLRAPKLVMAQGRLYKDITIKKDAEVEKELDIVLTNMLASN